MIFFIFKRTGSTCKVNTKSASIPPSRTYRSRSIIVQLTNHMVSAKAKIRHVFGENFSCRAAPPVSVKLSDANPHINVQMIIVYQLRPRLTKWFTNIYGYEAMRIKNKRIVVQQSK